MIAIMPPARAIRLYPVGSPLSSHLAVVLQVRSMLVVVVYST